MQTQSDLLLKLDSLYTIAIAKGEQDLAIGILELGEKLIAYFQQSSIDGEE